MNIEIYPSTEFHDRRKKGIGGSDIGKIMNVSAFGSALDVYCDKLGLTDPLEDSFPMRMGRNMEPIIRQEYLTQNDADMRFADSGFQMIVTKDDYYYYHPDGLLHDVVKDESYAVWEAKYSQRYNVWGDTPEDVPLEYQYQVQWGMFVCDLPYCDLSLIIGREYRQFRIMRDDALIKTIKTAVNSFWNDNVLTSTPPPPSDLKSDEELLKELYADLGEQVEADVELMELAEDYITYKENLKISEEKLQGLKNKIEAKMKNGNHCTSDFFKISWKQGKDKKKVDLKQSIQDMIDDGVLNESSVKEYTESNTIISPGNRPLLVKRVK